MRKENLRPLMFLTVLLIGLFSFTVWASGQQPSSPSQSPILEGNAKRGEWIAFDPEDQETISKALQKVPILEGEIESYKRQKDFDEKEKVLLNERLEIAKERLEMEKERFKIAEEKTGIEKERTAAASEAYASQKQITNEYKEIIKQQEKEITKAKLFGAGGILAGIGIALLAIIIAL